MLGSNGLDSRWHEQNTGSDLLHSTRIHEYVEQILDSYPLEDVDSEILYDYEGVFSFPLERADEIGQTIDRYNGAKRINTFRLKCSSRIKNPKKFLTVLEFCRRMSGVNPSHGIQTNPNRSGSSSITIPILIEFENGVSIGVFYFDEKRSISFPKIQKVEKAITAANLDAGIIVYNIYGVQAERELKRINEIHGNDNFLTMFRYSEIENELTLM